MTPEEFEQKHTLLMSEAIASKISAKDLFWQLEVSRISMMLILNKKAESDGVL